MRFLHLIRPVMCVLPEVASPDRKVREGTVCVWIRFFFLNANFTRGVYWIHIRYLCSDNIQRCRRG